MKQATTIGLVLILCAQFAVSAQQPSTSTAGQGNNASSAAAAPSIEFKEVFEVLRTNLPGVSEQELYRAAARGLIAQLRPQVTVLADQQPTNSIATNIAALRVLTLDNAYAYVRPGQVTAGSDRKFADALAGITRTNRLKGVVLDLRFSGGEDYGGAAAIADKFFSNERPLIEYGEGTKKSTPKTDAIKAPVAILVNGKTVGASEALAGILRHAETGLLIGANTGGQANIAKNVTLSTGQALRIATIPVKTGNGDPLPPSGLKPDIAVDVSPDEELGYVEEIYNETPGFTQAPPVLTNETASATGTNRSRRRINEAELVRMLRDGLNPEAEVAASATRRNAPAVIPDPALARALDLLKGLAVVQQSRTVGSEPRN